MLSKYPPLLLLWLIGLAKAVYIPELKVESTSDFLNAELAKNGPTI